MSQYGTSYKDLILFSLPSIAATLVEPLVELVDSALVGPLSVEHLSALSANGAIFAVSIWIFNFLVHVGSAEVASAVGRGDKKQLSEGVFLGLAAPFIIGSIMIVGLIFLGPMLLENVMSLDSRRLQLANDYYYIRCFSIPFALLLSSCSGILRGLGKVKLAFGAVGAMTTINVCLTFSLITFYDYGIKGAAIGTLISLVATSLPIAFYLTSKYLNNNLLSIIRSLDMTYFKSYAINSYNQFLRTLAISSSFFIASSYANSSGAVTGASHQVALHYWLLAAYVLDGFSVTATTIGADLWFSSQYKKWFLVAKKLLILSLGVGLCFSAVYYLFPHLIFLFTKSEAVYEKTLTVWKLIALFQIPNSILYTFDGLFFSQKNFKYIRQKIWQGFLFGFLPIVLIWGNNNLYAIWLAIIALNCFRFAFFARKLFVQSKVYAA